MGETVTVGGNLEVCEPTKSGGGNILVCLGTASRKKTWWSDRMISWVGASSNTPQYKAHYFVVPQDG